MTSSFSCRCAGTTRERNATADAEQTVGERREAEAAESHRDRRQDTGSPRPPAASDATEAAAPQGGASPLARKKIRFALTDGRLGLESRPHFCYVLATEKWEQQHTPPPFFFFKAYTVVANETETLCVRCGEFYIFSSQIPTMGVCPRCLTHLLILNS